MLVLFKLFGIFNFDFMTILTFILGIIFGMIILSLIYALFVVASIGDKKYLIKTEDDSLSEEKAKEMVYEARKAFKDKTLRGSLTKTQHFRKLSYDLVYGIASSFYPNSKHPMFELTIDESITLLDYVSKRLNEILDRKGIRLIKKFSISKIIDISLTSKSVMESKAFQVAKETKGAYNVFKKIINVVNPITWGRLLITDNAVKIIMNRLYLASLSIIGEEAYKIYSKKALNKDVEIDTGVDEIIDSAELEIQEMKNNTIKDLKEISNENFDLEKENKKLDFKFKVSNYNVTKNYNYNSILDSSKKVKEKKDV